jgi:TIR domain
VLFLSYAEQDSGFADRVAAWFGGKGHDVYRWQRAQQGGDLTVDGIEEQISRADDFVALLSPDFVASPLCHRERALAACREQGLKVNDEDARFVHVLQVRETEGAANGFPQRLDVVDHTHGEERALHDLAGRLGSRARASESGSADDGGMLLFQNREDEFELVLRDLTNVAGMHFWLVIAAPQMGKTWLLDRLSNKLILEAVPTWDVKLVDLRDQPSWARADVGCLLRCLFGPDIPPAVDRRTFLYIGQQIIGSKKLHLCLIDSAELLEAGIARALRLCLSEIHQIVSQGGTEARLAVVVASRREDEWRGVLPPPRLSPLPLTEFKVEVIQKALTELAADMQRNFTTDQLRGYAELVHGFSEGLPALLVRCLAWIRAHDFVQIELLKYPEAFAKLANSYIEDDLLALESLVSVKRQADPERGSTSAEASDALKQALRTLAPFRLFTSANLKHYIEHDERLARSVRDLDWDVEDLWKAIGGTALLVRPLNEPWEQMPHAIRRLLYRHFYPSESAQVAAHRQALELMQTWAEGIDGKEQVVMLVECLWHELAILKLGGRAIDVLIGSAQTLSQGLRSSGMYTQAELRGYAVDRIWDDDELRAAVGDEDIFRRIVEIVVAPE